MNKETTIKEYALQKAAASIEDYRITLVFTHEAPGQYTEIEVNHKNKSISVTTNSLRTVINKRRISNTIDEVYRQFLKGQYHDQMIDISGYQQSDFKI